MHLPDARRALGGLLDRLGVRPGQKIMLHSDMSGIPLPTIAVPLTREGIVLRKKEWCAFLLEELMRCLGSDGTLIVPTFTYSTTLPGGSFHVETTPSEVGPFSEYVRRLPETHRSVHPIFSLAAIGPAARDLMDDTGPAAFGAASPWSRFVRNGVRIVTLGLPFRGPTTYVHHLEQCFGAPHRYNKVVEVPVYQRGQLVNRPWLAYLRYRSIDIGVNLVPLEEALRSEALLMEASWGERTSSAADAASLDKIGYEMLRRDPWAFATRRVKMRLHEQIPTEGPLADPVVDMLLGKQLESPGSDGH